MRSGFFLACLIGGAVSAGPAAAQSPLDGPLAPPDVPALSAKRVKAKPKKPQRTVAAKPRSAVPKNAAPADNATRPPQGTPAAAAISGGDASADALSLGMKWQGNNDTPGQTRSQNLDGNAFGSGAEIGMKLHF